MNVRPAVGEPGCIAVGLGRERSQALGPDGIGDLDIPAPALELVVDEAGTVHGLDDAGGLTGGHQSQIRPAIRITLTEQGKRVADMLALAGDDGTVLDALLDAGEEG